MKFSFLVFMVSGGEKIWRFISEKFKKFAFKNFFFLEMFDPKISSQKMFLASKKKRSDSSEMRFGKVSRRSDHVQEVTKKRSNTFPNIPDPIWIKLYLKAFVFITNLLKIDVFRQKSSGILRCQILVTHPRNLKNVFVQSFVKVVNT